MKLLTIFGAILTTYVSGLQAASAEDRELIDRVAECAGYIFGYAGMETIYEPEYFVAVRFVGDARKKLSMCTENPLFIPEHPQYDQKEWQQSNQRIINEFREHLKIFHISFGPQFGPIEIRVLKQDLATASSIIISLGLPPWQVRLTGQDKVGIKFVDSDSGEFN